MPYKFVRHLLRLYRSCNRTTINHLRRAFSFSCFLPRKSHRQRLWLFLGRGRRIRTRDPRFWRPVLYQLSYTPLRRQYYSTHPAKKQGVSRKIRKLFCVQIAQQEPEAGDRQRKVFRKIRAAYPVQTKIRTLVNRQKSGSYTGGDKGSRTPDLLNAIQALSQLSYTPVKHRVTVHCHATLGYYITRQTVCQELFGKS